MDKLREHLYGCVVLIIIMSIWTPVMWFVSSARRFYGMETFEIFGMHWFSILLFFALCAAALFAQFGLLFMLQDLSDLKKFKEREDARRNGRTFYD